jgi:uncharacterized protein YajQ (UPF0234 family)
VQAQIMGDQVRISGKKRDDLQAAIRRSALATWTYRRSSSTRD